MDRQAKVNGQRCRAVLGSGAVLDTVQHRSLPRRKRPVPMFVGTVGVPDEDLMAPDTVRRHGLPWTAHPGSGESPEPVTVPATRVTGGDDSSPPFTPRRRAARTPLECAVSEKAISRPCARVFDAVKGDLGSRHQGQSNCAAPLRDRSTAGETPAAISKRKDSESAFEGGVRTSRVR